MKRHPSLLGLSRDHHAALVMSKRIAACGEDLGALAAMCEFVLQRFSSDLLPHFQDEEARIFPALQGVHEDARLRALDDHVALNALAALVADGDGQALLKFGRILEAHVRFEERELFPLYETLLGDA